MKSRNLHAGLTQARRRVRRLLAALAGHGVFDFKHFQRLTNPNLPIWLALLWIGYDVMTEALGLRLQAQGA